MICKIKTKRFFFGVYTFNQEPIQIFIFQVFERSLEKTSAWVIEHFEH